MMEEMVKYLLWSPGGLLQAMNIYKTQQHWPLETWHVPVIVL